MQIYKSKRPVLSATSYQEAIKQARKEYNTIKKRSKRQPYIRSVHKEKIFITLFWNHLYEKNSRDRLRRLRFYACGLDLLQNTPYPPSEKPSGHNYVLHRYAGISYDQKLFYVQVKYSKSTGRRDFMSVFPAN